jgi:hypothetical protein
VIFIQNPPTLTNFSSAYFEVTWLSRKKARRSGKYSNEHSMSSDDIELHLILLTRKQPPPKSALSQLAASLMLFLL